MNLPANRLVIRISKARILFINILITASLSILIIYLFTLQIVEGIKYQKRAKEILKRDIPIIAQRGQIYDRYYDVPLVYNIDSFAVNVIPGDIPDEIKEEVFFRLARVLQIEVSDVKKKTPVKYYNNYQPREIKSGVSYPKIAYIAEHVEDFPGVTWHNKPIRGYFFVDSLAHILGYTGDITNDELNTLYNKGYTLNSTIGKSGIEKQYDFILKGKDGKRFKIVDVKEKQLTAKTDEDIPPEPGQTLVLTIDRHLQLLAQKALGERIGAVVVLKPATGEILAMVSYPWFDPGIFYSESAAEKFKDLSLDIRFPFLNRAIQAQYPPASVFKIIMSTAMIEEGSFPISDIINCKGEMELGDRVAHCWKEHGHGKVDFFKAFANSCNIYFYTVGVENIKIDSIVRYARIFGLGSQTGIDLPEESPGFLPTPEWKYKKEHMKWLGGDTMNISIGQGWVTVTPLQLANVVAMIANEGTVYKPHVLKQIRDSITGDSIKEIQREELQKALISKKTFELVKKAMRTVVTDGTGYFITTRAVKVAGKTGTPETGQEDRYHSWFASYAPYDSDNPEDYVVVVGIIEASNIEEWWASRTANIIYQGIFANQTYEEALVTLYPWMRNRIKQAEETQNTASTE
ncbi:MAG: penicillin-binding protein 2 [Spirochaetales bacterium]|nr:penicillin-binding protein 2 [Spirochaetales bacterium]